MAPGQDWRVQAPGLVSLGRVGRFAEARGLYSILLQTKDVLSRDGPRKYELGEVIPGSPPPASFPRLCSALHPGLSFLAWCRVCFVNLCLSHRA